MTIFDKDGVVSQEQYDALATRARAAEVLLLLADETIEILHGDQNLDTVKLVLTAIELHWQTYPEPLE